MTLGIHNSVVANQTRTFIAIQETPLMLDEGADADAQEAAIITEYNDLCKLFPLRFGLWSSKFWLLDLVTACGFGTTEALHPLTCWNWFLVATNLANFTSVNTGVTAKLVNTTTAFQAVIDDPTTYGAANATCFDDDGTTCVWWNNYHPALASKSCLNYFF